MHERTGAIAEFENDLDAVMAGYTPIRNLVSAPPAHGKTELSAGLQHALVDSLRKMNRHERRAWAAQQRRAK